MTVVALPLRPRIVISSNLIRQTQIYSSIGVTVLTHVPPIKMYFLDFSDGGEEVGVWEGATYSAALEAAREWAKDGAEIRDLTHETLGSA